MTTKDEMLKKIYEVIADKTLSFGCKIRTKDGFGCSLYETVGGCYCFVTEQDCEDYISSSKYLLEKDIEIIGHPVMIGDVLDWLEKRQETYYPMILKKLNIKDSYTRISFEQVKVVREFIKKVGIGICNIDETSDYSRLEKRNYEPILEKWTNKRKSIDDQSDECIDFIYLLLS